MLHMIGHMIFGLIVGIMAQWLLPGHHSGLIVSMILGLAGAWLGGAIGRMTGMYGPEHPAGFFMALLGAVILLIVYRVVAG